MENKSQVIYHTTSIYIGHLVAIIPIVALLAFAFGVDRGGIGWGVFGIGGGIIWLLLYNNKEIMFYKDKIIIKRAYFNKTLLIIPFESIKNVEYVDALQVRFDNEKIRITYNDDDNKRIIIHLPLYMIKEDVLYELIENFRNAHIKTIVRSSKKVFAKNKQDS